MSHRVHAQSILIGVLFVLSLLIVPSVSHAATRYFWSDGSDTNWTTVGNWYTNIGHSSQAGSLPTGSDNVVTLGTVGPQVDLGTWGEPASINATATGITFTGAGSYCLYVNVIGFTSFNFNSCNVGAVTGTTTFNDYSYNSGTITGAAIFNNATGGVMTVPGGSRWGIGTATSIVGVDLIPITEWVFNVSSYNDGTITGTTTFNGSSYNQRTIIGTTTFNGSSSNIGIITGTAIFNNATGGVMTVPGGSRWGIGTATSIVGVDLIPITEWVFNGISYNTGSMTGSTTFNGTSYNIGTITGSTTFNASSYNDGTITGTTTFNGDSTENHGTINGTKIRYYNENLSTSRDFTSSGPWTVIADGEVINIHNATYDTDPSSPTFTTFQTLNGGSFVNVAAISINQPTANQTVTSWSPSISWNHANQGYTSCQYSYGNNNDWLSSNDWGGSNDWTGSYNWNGSSDDWASINDWGGSNDWNSGSDWFNTWKTADCNGNGSDVSAPSAGAWTLAARGTVDNKIGIALTSFTYNPTTQTSTPSTTQPTISYSSSGGSVSASVLASLLAPSASTTAYLNSINNHANPSVPGCPQGYVCTPNSSASPTIPGAALINPSTNLPTFTRDLKVGFNGADVQTLQQYLNTHGFTISITGAGSPGYETTTFGSKTKSALVKFQKANGIPSTGFFGPITRMYIGKCSSDLCMK